MSDDNIIAEAYCPYCRAEAGKPCVSLSGRRIELANVHESRRVNAKIFREVRAKLRETTDEADD